MVFESLINTGNKRVKFASEIHISANNQRILAGQSSSIQGLMNQSFKNIQDIEASNAGKNFNPSSVSQDFGVNYRLIQHLYSNYRYESNNGEPSSDVWTKIVKDYNFVTSSNYSVEDIKNIWKHVPSMEKRKLMIELSANDDQITATNKENNPKKTKKPPSLKRKNENHSAKPEIGMEQSQPLNMALKNNNTIDNKWTKMKDAAAQTENCMEVEELIKEEYHLKISILKLRLEIMQRHCAKYFDQ